MKKLFAILLLFFCHQIIYAANHYISRDCANNGDGTSWSCAGSPGGAGAWNNSPSPGSSLCNFDTYTWVGGDTYYFAGSETAYQNMCFRNYTGSGTVTLKKATASDHGTETGWQASYGTTVATMGIVGMQSFGLELLIDGQTGGGPDSWETGHGFHFYAENADSAVISIATSAALTIKHAEINFASSETSTGTYPIIYNVSGADNTTLQYTYVHDAPCDMVQLRGNSNWIVEYSKFARNKEEAACHGDPFETDNGGGPHIYRYNWFEDLEGTYFIGCHCSSVAELAGLEFYGNILSWSDTSTYHGFSSGNGLVSQLSGSNYPITGFKFYNNTIYNAPAGTGSVSFGNYFVEGSDADIKNNLFDTCNSLTVSYAGVTATAHDYNWYRSCGTITETNKQDGSGDPFTNVEVDFFTLSSNTDAGSNLGEGYNTDLAGSTRTTWSRGAYEYGSGDPPAAGSGSVSGGGAGSVTGSGTGSMTGGS